MKPKFMKCLKIQISKNEAILFRELSKDINPIHTNPSYASSTYFSDEICFGILALLKLLDKCNSSFLSLQIRFKDNVLYDHEYFVTYHDSLILMQDEHGRTILEVKYKQNPNSLFDISELITVDPVNLAIKSYPTIQPDIVSKLHKLYSINLRDFPSAFEALFPNLAQRLIPEILTFISSLSYIVGVELPGLNSLFLSADIEITESNFLPVAYNSFIYFKPISFSKTFGLITINCFSRLAQARISALSVEREFSRPLPSLSIPCKTKKNLSALVLGGTGGVGTLFISKLLSFGISTTFTYHRNENRANQILRTFSTELVNLSLISLSDSGLPECLSNSSFNLIVDCRSPKIMKSPTKNSFCQSLYELYYDWYVTKFLSIYDSTQRANVKQSYIYLSTSFIDASYVGFDEYVQAKLHGEALVKGISPKNTIIETIRLPPTPSKQQLIQIDNSSNLERSIQLINNVLTKSVSYINSNPNMLVNSVDT